MEDSEAPQGSSKAKALGVCACFGIVFAIFGSGIFGVMFAIIAGMKSMDGYSVPLERAKADPAVQEALGTPIEDGFFPQGSISTSNQSGSANLTISLSGPRGEGTLFVSGVKSKGVWSYSRLHVDVDGGESVPLLQPEKDAGVELPETQVERSDSKTPESR